MNDSLHQQMIAMTEQDALDARRCPVAAMENDPALLAEDTELVFLQHRRLFTEYSTDASGTRELHLYYGDKEISFDDPRLFAFGDGLAKHERFIAREATMWGAGYEWGPVRELLEQLISEGILTPAASAESALTSRPHGARPSPLPPAKCTVPRTWFESEVILRELTGHPLEVGYLEAVIPVSHVAHMAMDMEGRQVGEANVFPPQLRLDIPTEWRTCPHAGSRYLDDKPMNATALRSMRQHWPSIMTTLTQVRAAFLQRFPKARQGWTVGDLQRLALLVMALPGYLLMRSRNGVENGPLHPFLSGMVRVTDGIRMTTQEMLLASQGPEPNRAPDTPTNSADIYAYAERNFLFHSLHGVCAGPKALIDEFLGVLIDGKPVAGSESVSLDPAVQAALNDLDDAFSYGLYGLQSSAIVYSLWPAMRQTYEQLLTCVHAPVVKRSVGLNAFQERLQDNAQYLETSIRTTAAQYSATLGRMYSDLYEQCANGLGCLSTGTTYAECLTPTQEVQHAETTDQLRALLRQRICQRSSPEDQAVEDLVIGIMNYLRLEQAVVHAVSTVQQRINLLLGRPSPTRPLAASDLYLFYRLRGGSRRQPYLPDDLEELLGIHTVVTPDTILIADRGTS